MNTPLARTGVAPLERAAWRRFPWVRFRPWPARDRQDARASCCGRSPRRPRGRSSCDHRACSTGSTSSRRQRPRVDLNRLLWIRVHVVSNPGQSHDRNKRALEQSIQAITLLMQAGNFVLVVFDAADVPAVALARLPFTPWRRLQRMIEGSQTACLLVGDSPIARSPTGATVQLGKLEVRSQKSEVRSEKSKISNQQSEMLVDVLRGHARNHEHVRVPLSAAGC